MNQLIEGKIKDGFGQLRYSTEPNRTVAKTLFRKVLFKFLLIFLSWNARLEMYFLDLDGPDAVSINEPGFFEYSLTMGSAPDGRRCILF